LSEHFPEIFRRELTILLSVRRRRGAGENCLIPGQPAGTAALEQPFRPFFPLWPMNTPAQSFAPLTEQAAAKAGKYLILRIAQEVYGIRVLQVDDQKG
jgi:hypothetical protein